MHVNTRCPIGHAATFICLCVLGLVAFPCFAQQPDPLPAVFQKKIQVTLQGATMDATLAALAKDNHINIVADGEPLLQKADINLDGTLREALDKVADLFDYNWTVSRAGVVLMTKRFKNPKERPQFNLPEMLGLTHDMITALTAIDYDRDPSHWQIRVKQMASTFTTEQLRALESGKTLRGSDLLPTQQGLLQNAVVSKAFAGALHLWEDLLPNLEAMPKSRLQARNRDNSNDGGTVTAPEYEYLYIFRRADGQLHALNFPKIEIGPTNGGLVTP